MKLLTFLVFAFLWQIPALAQDQNADGLDPHSAGALSQTQQLLNNPQQRQKSINNGSPDQKKADDFVQQMTGNKKLTDEVYSLAADVFANVVKDAKGDPVKMKEAMEKFERDPASFIENWTPEQKQKLKELSEKIGVPILKQ